MENVNTSEEKNCLKDRNNKFKEEKDMGIEIAMARSLKRIGLISQLEFEKCVIELKKLHTKRLLSKF